MLFITLAATALFQYGSCQSGGPDRSRTAAEAAQAYVRGLSTRDPGAIRWVTRPGAMWRSPSGSQTDEAFYESLQPSNRPNQYPVVTGMTRTINRIALVTRLRGVEGSGTLTVLAVENGCIVNVQTF